MFWGVPPQVFSAEIAPWDHCDDCHQVTLWRLQGSQPLPPVFTYTLPREASRVQGQFIGPIKSQVHKCKIPLGFVSFLQEPKLSQPEP